MMMQRRVQIHVAIAALVALGMSTTCQAFVPPLRPAFFVTTKISSRWGTDSPENNEDAADEIHICQDAAPYDDSNSGTMSAFFELAHEVADEMHVAEHKQHEEENEASAFFELAHQVAYEMHIAEHNQHEEDKKANKKSWNDQHLAHQASELHEETPSELRESEDAAAWDAHDCSDSGMEAATEERAIMLANELIHKAKEEAKAKKQAGNQEKSWNDQHLAHKASELHEETPSELRESEDSAAWDAHDCSDPGMEAAAEERSVMLANEFMHKAKEEAEAKKQGSNQEKSWNDQHLAHKASELHEETPTELRESEGSAAWDAYDCSDPGMEAAAEERALMLANEFIHKAKEQARAKKQAANNDNGEIEP